MKRDATQWAILLVSLLGLALATYSITLYFAPSNSSFCNFGPNFNCDSVSQSQWATFLGIPVAVLGAIAYLAVFLLTLKQRSIKRWLSFEHKDFSQYMLLLTLVMVLFQLYLTLMEAFFIHAYCVTCLGSQFCTIVLALLCWKEWLR
jgi:uncharacterized membrane protein